VIDSRSGQDFAVHAADEAGGGPGTEVLENKHSTDVESLESPPPPPPPRACMSVHH